MPEDIENDPTDPATKRPRAKPLKKTGTCFKPMEIDDFGYEITLPSHTSPDDPLSVFTEYYTLEIVQTIVKHTNSRLREPQNLETPLARARGWYPTCVGEIYLYLAIRIYMTINIRPEIADYWDTKESTSSHPLLQRLPRNRFQELHMRFRVEGDNSRGPYEKVDSLSRHFQEVNTRLWQPGSKLAVDEIMVGFEGRASEATTIPNKPTPTGFKVWGIAQVGFLLLWNFHVPGEGNGPVGIKTPRELGGSVREGKGGNKSQAVALSLLERHPKRTNNREKYHVFLDNLFTSHKFLELLRDRGFAATGTCRTNAGVLLELIELKNSDQRDIIPWGELHSLPTSSNLVCQTAWKDNSMVLMMSTIYDGRREVYRNRKRPKKSSAKARTSRVPFNGQPTKILPIPENHDQYNYHMGAVDEFDHLTANSAGLRPVRRGGAQAMEHWLLRVALINTYQICKYAETGSAREVDFRSQQDLRTQLVDALLHISQGLLNIVPKRRISKIDLQADSIPFTQHQIGRMTRNWCKCCRGLRASDRPQKRVALGEIAAVNNRQERRISSRFGCIQCDVNICRKGGCWERFHGI